MLADRLTGFALIALAVGLAWQTFQFHVPYQYEPLGPRFFPYLIALTFGICGLMLAAQPAPMRIKVNAAQLWLLLLLVVYALCFEFVGFFLSTVACLMFSARLAGQRWTYAALGALSLAVLGYVVLVWALGLNLRRGRLWTF